ncbi:MAG TPA: hypothetical protein VLG44_04725 [Chlamydiales bacterium]|nr:hypothetical protein [Chlamydiales bacterium]
MAALASITIKSNTIKAEDLAAHRTINCPLNSPVPGAIKAIKDLVAARSVWLEQPIMRTIANTDYTIMHTPAVEYSSLEDWKVTLGGDVLLVQREGKVSINGEHKTNQPRSCVIL